MLKLKFFLLMLLIQVAFLRASYLSVTWGGDLLLKTLSGDPTFFMTGPIFPQSAFLGVAAWTGLDLSRERATSMSIPMTGYNHSSLLNFNQFTFFTKPMKFLLTGLQVRRFKSFDYDFRDSAGNNLLFSSHGNVYDCSVDIDCELKNIVEFGVHAGLLLGGQEIKNFSPGGEVLSDDRYVYSGFLLTFLAGTTIIKDVLLEFQACLPASVERASGTGKDRLIWPFTLGLRFEWSLMKQSRTWFFAETTWQAYGSFKAAFAPDMLEFTPYGFHDIVSVIAGLGQQLPLAIPLKVKTGYVYEPCYSDRYADLNGIFTGLSFQPAAGGRLSFTLDGIWTWQDRRGDGILFDANSIVDDSALSLEAGVSLIL